MCDDKKNTLGDLLLDELDKGLDHVSQDQLLLFSEDLLDPDEQSEVDIHLADCKVCQEKLFEIRKTSAAFNERLGEVENPFREGNGSAEEKGAEREQHTVHSGTEEHIVDLFRASGLRFDDDRLEVGTAALAGDVLENLTVSKVPRLGAGGIVKGEFLIDDPEGYAVSIDQGEYSLTRRISATGGHQIFEIEDFEDQLVRKIVILIYVKEHTKPYTFRGQDILTGSEIKIPSYETALSIIFVLVG